MDLARSYPQFAVQMTRLDWESDALALIRHAYDECLTLFAARLRGSGKSFCDHLVGTASGVALGGGAPAVIAAALLHAAYECGDFGDGRPGASDAHRQYIADRLGGEVEALVYRYHELGWSPSVASRVWESIDEMSSIDRTVLLIRVANEVDDAIDGGLVVSSKENLPAYQNEILGVVGRIAERVAAASFADHAKRVFAEPPIAIRDELILGWVGSRTVLPQSAAVRLHFRIVRRAQRSAQRIKRRLAGGSRRIRHRAP